MKKQFKNGNAYLVIAVVMMVILFISSAYTYEQQSQISLLEKILGSQPLKKQLSGISFLYAGSPVSIADSGYFGFVEFFIRKAAHFGSYFIMAGALFLGLEPRLKNVLISGFVSWLAATGYAGLDEFHQMLTGGRSPLFEDVALDSMGAFTAVSLCILVILLRRMRKKR